jgi:hypothetical protein
VADGDRHDGVLGVIADLALVIGCLSVVIGSTLAAWWMIGDLTSSQIRGRADYMVHPPDISPSTERLAALIGLLVAAGLSVWIGWWVARRSQRMVASIVVVVGLWVIGFGFGFCLRAITVGYTGASFIGLVFPVIALLLVGLVLLIAAAVLLVERPGRARRPVP